MIFRLICVQRPQRPAAPHIRPTRQRRCKLQHGCGAHLPLTAPDSELTREHYKRARNDGSHIGVACCTPPPSPERQGVGEGSDVASDETAESSAHRRFEPVSHRAAI
jgi:hypothetical protein